MTTSNDFYDTNDAFVVSSLCNNDMFGMFTFALSGSQGRSLRPGESGYERDGQEQGVLVTLNRSTQRIQRRGFHCDVASGGSESNDCS
ncbi:hypothetical protein BDV98DRAFT_140954 [Pterulicium gracile]|uniref:Uncharacterized protein n=1 Tax=Pterulicium gracile TaxID=1884261 RepID=A0A5C3QXU3_9AGAR|nr:hypothetical protein BDV98DRAFT_140954 [Pterula gracilis]